MSLKGQTFSFDFLMACSVFLLATGILFLEWYRTSSEISETETLNDMIDKTYLASEVWLREGTPKYWNPDNVISLGLQNDYQLNWTKMNYLNEIGYAKVKNLIGVNPYELFFRVYDRQNVTLFSFGVFPLDADNIIKVKRVSILNKTIVFIDVLVYE
jgi:hypothetical protein